MIAMRRMSGLLLVWMMSPLLCWGWGATGHRASGHLAEQLLTSKARKKVKALLHGHSLAMVSTWLDEVRSDSTYDYTGDWHWTTIPDGKRYEDVAANPDGKAVTMVELIIQKLKQGGLPARQEEEYVKALIHLVADLHQPCHVGNGLDRGANDVKVKWFGRDSNLHRVWDSHMIDDTQLSYTELAQSFVMVDKATLAQWKNASVRDWAHESMTYRPAVYAIGDGNLSYQYSYRNFSTVQLRLLQSSVRLAHILNQIYG
jgi:hypothetical protein